MCFLVRKEGEKPSLPRLWIIIKKWKITVECIICTHNKWYIMGYFKIYSVFLVWYAWTNKGTSVTQSNGNDKYVIPTPEAGLEGGTNNIVTAFPSKY